MDTAQAPSEPTLAFPPKGALRRFAFPKLVREIARGKVTGSLYLLNGQTKKVVFFEQGQPVFVRSNVLAECLGQVLSSEGLITNEQCEQTLEAIRRTGKKQGELLVEMGILSEGNLRYGLAAQLRAKLYDIFAWDDGRYQFKPDVPTNQFGVRLEARPEAVIIGAILDRYDEERAEKLLGPSMDKFLVYGEDAPLDVNDLALLPEERYFVECIDGSRTVASCVRDELAESVPNPYALVFGLVQAGVVDLSDEALEARPRPAQPDFDARPDDEALRPGFDSQNVVTEYEDTPLPGELPKVRGLLGDHEDDFADVEALETGTSITAMPTPESGSPASTAPQVSEELIAAEPDQVEETFDDAELREEVSGPNPVEPQPEAQDAQPESQPDDDPAEPPHLDELDAMDDLVDPLAGLELDEEDVELEPDPEPAPSLDEPAPPAEPDPEPPPELTAIQPEPLEPAAPADQRLEQEEVAHEVEEVVDEVEEVELDEVVELDELDEIEELDIDGLDLDEPEPAPAPAPLEPAPAPEPQPVEPALQAPLDDDPGATRADPLPPLTVNRDLASEVVEPPQEDGLDDIDLDASLDPDAPLDDFDVDDDLLLDGADGDDLVDLDDVDLDAVDLGPEPDVQPAALEADDDLALDDLDPEAPLPAPAEDADADADDGLMGLDDLDDIDLGDPAPATYAGSEATFQEDQDPEMVGAMRFNEAETALGEQRFPDAVALLESAYDNGFDVAELHAMLAYARFMAAGQDLETAQHAFELLDYAESMDPSLDLVWAYRGTIHHALRDHDQARGALQRALELNPYCEIAIQLMDQLG